MPLANLILHLANQCASMPHPPDAHRRTHRLQFGAGMCAQSLKEVRAEICKQLGLSEEDLELSMGMSGDFEQAVRVIGQQLLNKLP